MRYKTPIQGGTCTGKQNKTGSCNQDFDLEKVGGEGNQVCFQNYKDGYRGVGKTGDKTREIEY